GELVRRRNGIPGVHIDERGGDRGIDQRIWIFVAIKMSMILRRLLRGWRDIDRRAGTGRGGGVGSRRRCHDLPTGPLSKCIAIQCWRVPNSSLSTSAKLTPGKYLSRSASMIPAHCAILVLGNRATLIRSILSASLSPASWPRNCSSATAFWLASSG